MYNKKAVVRQRKSLAKSKPEILKVESEIKGELLLDKTEMQEIPEDPKEVLIELALEMKERKKSQLVESIKTIVIEQVYSASEPLEENFSIFLQKKLNYDYTYLSNLFATSVGITLEHYIINNKIERVKGLLFYDELTMAEIALKMNYSSAAHLSKQFKKTTGITASHFKKLTKNNLDQSENIISITNDLKSAEPHTILEVIEYRHDSVVTKKILNKSSGHVSVMSFDKGEGLSEKKSPFDTFAQVIDGKAEIVIDGTLHVLNTGEGIIIPAHHSNVINAKERFKIIMTDIKSSYEK